MRSTLGVLACKRVHGYGLMLTVNPSQVRSGSCKTKKPKHCSQWACAHVSKKNLLSSSHLSLRYVENKKPGPGGWGGGVNWIPWLRAPHNDWHGLCPHVNAVMATAWWVALWNNNIISQTCVLLGIPTAPTHSSSGQESSTLISNIPSFQNSNPTKTLNIYG